MLSLIAGLVHRNFLGDACFLIYLTYIIFSCYAFSVMTRQLCRHILQLMLSLSFPSFIVAVIQCLIAPRVRPISVFYNANFYGFICELLILAGLYALLQYRRYRVFYAVSIVVNVVGLILSGCRSALPAVLVGALIILAAQKKVRILLGVLITGIVGTVVVLIDPKIIPRFSSFDSTQWLRFKIWGTAFDSFLQHPVIGGGFMRFWQITEGRGHRVHQPHAHDMLLNALLCYGVVGVILLLIFIVPAVIGCIKKVKIRPECALVLGAIGAILVHGVTDDPILGMQTGIFAMLFMTLGGARAEEETGAA